MLLQGEIWRELLSTGAELSLCHGVSHPSLVSTRYSRYVAAGEWWRHPLNASDTTDFLIVSAAMSDPKPTENQCRKGRRQADILCFGVIIIAAKYVFPNGLLTDLVGRRNAIKQRTPHPSLPPNHPPNCVVPGGSGADPVPYKLKFS